MGKPPVAHAIRTGEPASDSRATGTNRGQTHTAATVRSGCPRTGSAARAHNATMASASSAIAQRRQIEATDQQRTIGVHVGEPTSTESLQVA